MRTGSYAYHVMRRDMLAFGSVEITALQEAFERFSAESEDACALIDALQSYDEQATREAELMRKWTKGRSLGMRCQNVRAFAGVPDPWNYQS